MRSVRSNRYACRRSFTHSSNRFQGVVMGYDSRLAATTVCGATTATPVVVAPSHPSQYRWSSSSAALRNNVESSSANQIEGIQRHAKYPKLFTPLNLGPDIGIIPNRVLMGSMHTGLEPNSMPHFIESRLQTGQWWSSSAKHQEKDEEQPGGRMAAYFAQRAKGGVGLIVTGGIAPNRAGWTGPFGSQLSHKSQLEYHQTVTSAVHNIQIPIVGGIDPIHNPQGLASVPARICLQILHTGRYGHHPLAVSASTTKSPISPFKARGLSVSGIQQTVADFIHTAVLAKEAGYDGVEVMGSEGYLLSQFVSPRTNQRTDQYGGESVQSRGKIILDIISGIREQTGPDFIIIFRLSLLDLVDQGLLFEPECLELATLVQHAGATMINTGIGWHESRVPTIATSVPRGAFAFCTQALRDANVVSIPLVATNRINHPATAEQILQTSSDMVSMARPFLADPALVAKSREGREDEINTCIGCNQACLDHVFVGKIASCLVNPMACHETQLQIQDEPLPVEQRLKISVVGAGPAGCAFAITAAQQGHSVTLYDQDNEIGGQFHMAKRIPGKEEFHETLRYFRTMMRKHNVNVQLNTRVTHEQMMSSSDQDKWIIATGVTPRDPRIPGQDHPNVLSYIDVLKHKKPVGKRVAVIGAGGIGFDVSEYILHYSGKDYRAHEITPQKFWEEWGIDTTLQNRGGLKDAKPHIPDRSIYLLQRKKGKLGAGLGKTTGWIHRATLHQSKRVEMLDGVTYDKIDDNGHLHITRNNHQSQVLEVDTIVICAGQVEYQELAQQATNASTTNDSSMSSSLASKVYTIGGAYAAGELDAKRAIDMGTRLALKIHEPNVVPGQHVFGAEQGVEEKLYKLLKRFM